MSRRLRASRRTRTRTAVLDKILFQHELFQHDRFLLQSTVGAMPHDKVLRSIELFATDVAPAVREEVGRRTADADGNNIEAVSHQPE